MKEIWKNVVASVISAVLIALIFFVWSDFLNKEYDISGAWDVEYTISETSYAPFENMTLFFDVLLQQSDSAIVGSGEKIAEQTKNNNKYEHERKNRVHIEITGNIKNNFILKDIVRLHYVEHGSNRDSSTTVTLKVKDSNTMIGTFFSTAADSKGNAIWKRK